MRNEEFESKGCIFVENFLDQNTILLIKEYFQNKLKRGEWEEGNEVPPVTRYSYYADPLIEVILNESTKAVEEITGKELIPTYSYSRIYQTGECLKPHTDRPSCEISVTVNVCTNGNFSPIYTKYGKRETEKHILNPGDAVVYKGCEVVHWRETLKEEQTNVQFMLHYVDKNGPNKEYAKDKRPDYGLNSDTRRE